MLLVWDECGQAKNGVTRFNGVGEVDAEKSDSFGDECGQTENRVTRFISIGELNPIRRNVKILLDAVAYLVDRGITDFHVVVIGSGNLEIIDPQIRRFFTVLGRVPYPVMYAETAKSVFFSPCLIPIIPTMTVTSRWVPAAASR